MQSVYSTAPADWATGHSFGKSYPSTEMQLVYSTARTDWARLFKVSNRYIIDAV